MARTHIALEVSHLHDAVDFYRAFLGADPLRVLPGYAQFLVEDPPLNLALTERSLVSQPGGHFGLEVLDASLVDQALTRSRAAGLDVEREPDTLCCHARQEKFWVRDPDGRRWEVFWVRERLMAATPAEREGSCCAG